MNSDWTISDPKFSRHRLIGYGLSSQQMKGIKAECRANQDLPRCKKWDIFPLCNKKMLLTVLLLVSSLTFLIAAAFSNDLPPFLQFTVEMDLSSISFDSHCPKQMYLAYLFLIALKNERNMTVVGYENYKIKFIGFQHM
ncbi:unnamed protein product [Soboliphyme baturini]|uniref:Transmembrane protein n=1 Tax=Soboliphyme baturini TaxID=241478 RepID=A0A183J680_9BILA|nr:unnamed protein product [Soboliphyme baturini]